MDVYDRIDEALQKMGMSRRRLAMRAELSPSTLNSAFIRRSGLSVEAVATIAHVLDVDANYLLNGERLEGKYSKDYIEELLREFQNLIRKPAKLRETESVLAEAYGYPLNNLDDGRWSVTDQEGFENILNQDEYRTYRDIISELLKQQYHLIHNSAIMTIMNNRQLEER